VDIADPSSSAAHRRRRTELDVVSVNQLKEKLRTENGIDLAKSTLATKVLGKAPWIMKKAIFPMIAKR
jgi:hypothetical protein